jgi:hypothetical protein
MGKTVDLMLAGAASNAGAELWSLRDEHYEEVAAILKRAVRVPGTFPVRWVP